MTDKTPQPPRAWTVDELVAFERSVGRHVPGHDRHTPEPGPLRRRETPEQELARLARQAPISRQRRRTRRPHPRLRELLIALVVALAFAGITFGGLASIGLPVWLVGTLAVVVFVLVAVAVAA